MTPSSDQVSWFHKASDTAWTRHANPWSVYTRMAIIPLAVVAIWSRDWIGWWSLVPIGLLVVWAVVNPYAFPPVHEPRGWASKGIHGERIQMDRHTPIPKHHKKAFTLIMPIAIVGGLIMTWGLYALEIWPTVFGASLLVLGQLWRIDRMVWMYEELHPEHGTAST